MTTGPRSTLSAFALRQDEGEALWFLDALATIKASGDATGGRCTVIEFLAPQGHGTPLHVHRREDEWFYVIEGQLMLWVGGQRIEAPAGSFAFAPRDIPHTFAVTSPTARFLLGAEPGGFDQFVRSLSVPGQARTLPPTTIQPPAPEQLTAAAARHGIEILGPPGIPA